MPNNFYYNKNLKENARRLRKDSTPGEINIWTEVLSKRQMKGYRFLRQRPILNYIVDFFCKELKLIIEIDGSSHIFKQEEDLRRDNKLKSLGFHVIRFEEQDVRNDIDNVARELKYQIERIEKLEN